MELALKASSIENFLLIFDCFTRHENCIDNSMPGLLDLAEFFIFFARWRCCRWGCAYIAQMAGFSALSALGLIICVWRRYLLLL